ncbi:MAG: hypothetical protein ACFFBP_18525 [Promethearchaeota archaeon]
MRLLIMEVVFNIICVQLGIALLYRYLKAEKSMRNSEELGLSLIYLGFFVMEIFFVISDYYSSEVIISPFFIWRDGSIRFLFLNAGYFPMLIIGIMFLYSIEKHKIYLFKRYFFTYIFTFFGIVFCILFIIDIKLTQPMTYVLWAIYIVFLLIYFINFIKKVQKNRQKLIFGILKFFPGLFLFLFGFSLTSSLMISIFGHLSILIGNFLQIIGIMLLFYFFVSLPPFSEFNWYETIEEILIINKVGLAIFEKRIHHKEEDYDGVLVGGALTSMNIILESMTKTKREGISILEKKGKTIIIFQSTNITGVIFCTKNLRILQMLLQKFVLRIESLYGNIFSKWDGELSIFEPVAFICDEIFKKEE